MSNIMVYTIEYIKDGNTHVLYDIDLYMKLHEDYYDRMNHDVYDAWMTEINNICFGDGIAQYVYDKIHNEETLEKFKKDCEKMSWLRGFLHEEHYDYWMKKDEANKFFNSFKTEIDLIIDSFALKWGLKVKK